MYIVWLPHQIRDALLAEADHWYDLETGGCFMGYWSSREEVVVTAHIPAGPNASRDRFRFEPDTPWQQQKINDHYAASGRLDTYLGEWHTHPGATTAHLSFTDRACIKRIISTTTARQPTPIMMLLVGQPGAWSLHPKVCSMNRFWGIIRTVEDSDAMVRVY